MRGTYTWGTMHDDNATNVPQAIHDTAPIEAVPTVDETLYHAVWSLLAEKAEIYEETELVSQFPPLHHFNPDAVWIGAFSRSIPAKRWRLVYAPVALFEGTTISTPPQVARAYLDYKYPKQLRATGKQLEFWKPRRVAPMYTEPGFYRDEMVYLDLKSAYWSILKVIGWDVEYFPGMLVRRSSVADFPYPRNKIARNSLVTLGLPGTGFMWKDGKLISTPHSWRVNLGIWSAVQDILQAIANEMILRCGAVYVNTDGYIIPADAVEVAYGIADEWRVTFTEKGRGRASVYGVGAYAIGERRVRSGKRMSPAYSNIRTFRPDDLKRYFAFLSDNPTR
jgi:hypothetical protein